MAPKQADLSKFLYGGRVNVSGIVELSDSLTASCDLGQGAGTDTEGGGSESFGDNVSIGTTKPALSSDSDVQVLDPAIASPLVEAARLRRQGYEKNRQFQDAWAARFPWAESVLGSDGRVAQVRCTVCSEVEGREKLLIPKLDSLWKHSGRRRAIVDAGKIKKGSHFFVSTCAHSKNERIYFARGGSATVVQLMQEGATRENKKKNGPVSSDFLHA